MALRRALIAGALALALAGPALACENFAAAPSSRWRIVEEASRAWLVTPCGTRFFSLGVNVLDGGVSSRGLSRAHYAWQDFDLNLGAWIAETQERLALWGFNTAGPWSLPIDQLRLPAMINLELGRNARFHWFDPFDPEMPAIMRSWAHSLIAPSRDSPYRIGYFSDNEVGWWGGALFGFYSMKPPANHTKQRWIAMLREAYGGDFARFTADFVPPAGVADWDGLLAAREMTRLRPGGRGIDAVRRWTGIVSEHYYRLARDAIHAADPDALFLGDRLPIYYDPTALGIAARYVDAISVNYNVDSPEGWIAPYFFDGLRALTSGKPVLITEWFYAARENRTGNRNNGHLMTVDTQAERAAGAVAASAAFARVPEVAGLHWFQYYDHPRGGRADGEDYDFGLVDIDNRPYEQLVTQLGAINRALPQIHAAARRPEPAAARAFVIPKAAIDPAHLSLIDWPKPQSLLPPLQAVPGEVAFGEAYLSWSPRGLALATIGQDYYDVDLLDFAGAFPLSEAYRVELEVDAGGGPRSFTFYFIPPRTKEKDHPPMAPKLCLGAPADHEATSCPPVPGAEALYFGADQPRIAAEALLPWSALGLQGPPASGKLKVELSSTAWHRSRWMSLSGLAPDAGARHPERWTEMTLGGMKPAY